MQMLHKSNGTFKWLEFQLFQYFAEVRHAIFLKQEENDTASLKRSLLSHATSPLSNYRLPPPNKQMHGSSIVLLDTNFFKNELECDGFITQQRELPLIVEHADCQACILYDPIHHAIGCIHSGWRGNIKKIYTEAIAKMKTLFQTRPADLFVGISPSLGPCCAEFIHYRTEFPKEFIPFQAKLNHFNLWDISKHELMKAGIQESHLQIAQMCTCCNEELFFSYRRNKTSQRHATFISLVSPNPS